MKKVLIVNDTKNIRARFIICLEIEEFEVITAKNRFQALETFKNEQVDLVFLDIKMPELSGAEVLRKVRGMGNYTPIVIMIAFATVKNFIMLHKYLKVGYRSVMERCIYYVYSYYRLWTIREHYS